MKRACQDFWNRQAVAMFPGNRGESHGCRSVTGQNASRQRTRVLCYVTAANSAERRCPQARQLVRLSDPSAESAAKEWAEERHQVT